MHVQHHVQNMSRMVLTNTCGCLGSADHSTIDSIARLIVRMKTNCVWSTRRSLNGNHILPRIQVDTDTFCFSICHNLLPQSTISYGDLYPVIVLRDTVITQHKLTQSQEKVARSQADWDNKV